MFQYLDIVRHLFSIVRGSQLDCSHLKVPLNWYFSFSVDANVCDNHDNERIETLSSWEERGKGHGVVDSLRKRELNETTK